MFCRTCHYDLSHYEHHRCPECGLQFHPLDETTYLRERPPPRDWWRFWINVAILALVAATLASCLAGIIRNPWS
jgi:hypothetical protein